MFVVAVHCVKNAIEPPTCNRENDVIFDTRNSLESAINAVRTASCVARTNRQLMLPSLTLFWTLYRLSFYGKYGEVSYSFDKLRSREITAECLDFQRLTYLSPSLTSLGQSDWLRHSPRGFDS